MPIYPFCLSSSPPHLAHPHCLPPFAPRSFLSFLFRGTKRRNHPARYSSFFAALSRRQKTGAASANNTAFYCWGLFSFAYPFPITQKTDGVFSACFYFSVVWRRYFNDVLRLTYAFFLFQRRCCNLRLCNFHICCHDDDQTSGNVLPEGVHARYNEADFSEPRTISRR